MLRNYKPNPQRYAIARLSAQHTNLDYTLALLFSLWLFVLIALPVVQYFWGERVLTYGVTAGVICQAFLVLIILERAWGLRQTVQVGLTVTLVSLMVEAIGTATGYPFGTYDYTDRLQPQLAHVPLLVPLAWLMMLPPGWAAAQVIAGGRWSNISFVGLSALAMTAWDLFLDPQMVAWGYWIWAEPGGYFGIPWANYAGWLLTAAFITVLVRPKNLPVYPLVAIYITTWLLETFGQIFFWSLPGPALAGFIGMGSIVGLAWWARIRSTR